MGMLVDGRWHKDASGFASADGRFERKESALRNWVTPDGAPGPGGQGGFEAEPGRYHLYVSLACPWAHRTLILRRLKGLEDMIGLSIVHWLMLEDGWTFAPGEGVLPDPFFGARALHEVYAAAEPGYTGRATVPVLFDKKLRRIVSNESAEIMRMFNSAFDQVGAKPGDFYPADLRPEIDAINARVYDTLNNGVYKAGFATTQAAYEENVRPLFDTLDWLEAQLGTRRYLCGDRPTEADWRLFTTLIRFDPVYATHFKCNLRRIADYPHLQGYLRELYQMPGVAETVNFHHIKSHYFGSHRHINPSGIVPAGPILHLDVPHGRGSSGS
ncbi:MAG: glutathionyl-hydroquinone reductase YqjG [Hyphomicrobiales bacterium]|nr:glutathionyl-hydroquinone reductase YqjG [Hyphomicrobiales bacterium]